MILRRFVQDTRSMLVLSSAHSMSVAYGIAFRSLLMVFLILFLNSCPRGYKFA